MRVKLIFVLILAVMLMCSCHTAALSNPSTGGVSDLPDGPNNGVNCTTENHTTESTGMIDSSLECETCDLTQEQEWIPDKIVGDIPTLYIENYTTYQKMLRSADFSDNFVFYEQIKELGEFEDFCCLTYHSSGDFSAYFYVLSIGNGKTIMLKVDARQKETVDVAEYAGELTQDMRNIEPNETAYKVESNGMTYIYILGKLDHIRWNQDGLRYTLSLDDIVDVPTSELPTALIGFLNSTTAADALASIKASINTPVTE